MARWNALPPRNAARFAPPTSETLPIVLLAHDRELYLRPGLRLWAAVKGIEQAVLVASHHGTHDGVWRLVEGVRFCAVQQLIFPHAGRYRGAHVLKRRTRDLGGRPGVPDVERARGGVHGGRLLP